MGPCWYGGKMSVLKRMFSSSESTSSSGLHLFLFENTLQTHQFLEGAFSLEKIRLKNIYALMGCALTTILYVHLVMQDTWISSFDDQQYIFEMLKLIINFRQKKDKKVGPYRLSSISTQNSFQYLFSISFFLLKYFPQHMSSTGLL